MVSLCDQQALFTPQFMRVLSPRPRIGAWNWLQKHGRNTDGHPFDVYRMPWARGPCDAWDNPGIRKIVMMWGTRLGKTLLSINLMAYAMASRPANGIYTNATEKLALRTVKEKIYKVLEHIDGVRDELPTERWRSASFIRTNSCAWAVGWSGSHSTLADWDAMYAYSGEVDKYSSDKTESGQAAEGDTLSLVDERCKDWPDHKIIQECSPSLKGKSRIERLYLASNQCVYHVPCRHCGKFQRLKMGAIENGELIGGGLRFQTPEKGIDVELARKTAVYVCDHCGGEIQDQHRRKMMRGGVWVPRGCRARDGKVIGEPAYTGPIWGGQLSSLYSMQLTWGAIAAKFVGALSKVAELQTFVNGWLGETWEEYKRKSDPETVGERLSSDHKRGEFPAWCTWLFAAVDVQAEYFKWIKLGCGPGERIAVVDYGYCDTWSEVKAHVLQSKHKPAATFIDSGDGKRTKEVYGFCRKHTTKESEVIPCKGANTNCNGEPYQKVTIGDGTHEGTRSLRRKAMRARGVVLVRVNPFFWQPEIDKWLYDQDPGEPNSLVLPADSLDDIEFLDDLCNGAPSNEASKMDPDKTLWVKRDENIPNDWRDCLAYARCAMEVKFRSDWKMAERPQANKPIERVAKPKVEQQRVSLNSGRRIRLKRSPRRVKR